MTNKSITVEQVLNFLTDKQSGTKVSAFVEQELKKMNLPKSIEAFDNDTDDELLDEVLDYGICFHCDFGEPDYTDDVYVVGYNPKTRELLVRGGDNLDGISPVGLDELEFNSLLELAQTLYIS